ITAPTAMARIPSSARTRRTDPLLGAAGSEAPGGGRTTLAESLADALTPTPPTTWESSHTCRSPSTSVPRPKAPALPLRSGGPSSPTEDLVVARHHPRPRRPLRRERGDDHSRRSLAVRLLLLAVLVALSAESQPC